MLTLVEGLGFPEGPVWMPDGSIAFVDMVDGTLCRVSENAGFTELAALGGGPNGAALGPNGRVYICNNGGGDFVSAGGPPYTGGRIETVDINTGSVEVLYRSAGRHKLSAPNDLVFDTADGFWFTDFGKRFDGFQMHGSVYWARHDGSQIRQVITGLHSPNGIGLSPDRRTLYVTETLTARLWSWRIRSPGQVYFNRGTRHGGRLVLGSESYRRFDSLAVSKSGQVLIGTLEAGGITEVDPTSGQSWFHPIEDRYVTNVCFGGDHHDTVFLTLAETGRIVALPWHEAGLGLADA